MKTVNQIQAEIKEATKSFKIIRPSRTMADIGRIEKHNNAIRKQIELLRQCELYIKTNPRLEYLKLTEIDLETKITSINSHYERWLEDNKPKHKNPKTVYQNLMGVSLLKQQLKTIRYLIDE